jgi:hypothetical protein
MDIPCPPESAYTTISFVRSALRIFKESFDFSIFNISKSKNHCFQFFEKNWSRLSPPPKKNLKRKSCGFCKRTTIFLGLVI